MAKPDKQSRIDITPYFGTRTQQRMNVTEEQFLAALAACNWKWHEVEDDLSTPEIDEFEVAKASYQLVFSLYDALCINADNDEAKLKRIKEMFNANCPEQYRLA